MSAPDFGVGTAANVCAAGIIGIFQEIKRHVRYVFNYKKIVQKFEEKMKLLIAKRKSVQQEVDAAKRNVEKIKADVELWCERVDKTINEEAKKVKDLENKAKARCFIGLCPNIKSRYQLSKKAEDVAVVDELLQQGRFDKVGFRDVPEASISAARKNFAAFDSRKAAFDEIMEALKDSTTSIMGVYGTGGVGKTTLVKEVARQVQEANLFGPVVLATVTQTPHIEKIQDQIAETMGLKLEEKSIPVRARRLSERLKKEKKILIVLDDVWTRLDVEEVGICFGDEHEECKVLLTSRNRNVLTDEMDAKKTISLDVLKENEAWDLFKKMAENDFEIPDLQSVAIEVAKKCAGLPLTVVAVARALRNKGLPEWRDALLQLQRPSLGNFTGIPEAVYSAIQVSYDYLKSEELKKTFLLSCLFGHNACIEDLLRCAMGLQLFGDTVITVEETRNRVLTMVSKLKASCLLLDGYSDDRFSMHDFVLDVALAIASRDIHAFALRREDVFEEWPDEEKMQNFKMICLRFASIKKLPHELECPQLTLFSMDTSSEDSYLEMPPSFFKKMKKIRVLDLIRTDFSSSASSISLPTSLRTLRLKRCRLGDMVSLEKLKNLEILSLCKSDIEMLPEEIRQLTNLRSLDLTACSKLRIISPGILSSLSRLEELYLSRVIVRWNQQGNARLDELKELPCLTALYICILDASVPKDLISEKLQRYKILIGVKWKASEKFENSRALKLRVNTCVDQLDDEIKGLLKKTEALHLQDSTSVHQHELPLFGEQIELPRLVDLCLSNINVVGRIWHNQFSTLQNLTSLKITDCDNLKDILSSSTSKSLTQLKSFEISRCKRLREIIFHEDIEEDDKVTISFPQLSTLRMKCLKHFIGFCSESYNIAFPSLKTLEINNCPELKNFIYKSTIEDNTPLFMQALFDEKVTFSQIEELRLTDLRNCRKIWHDQLLDDSFSKLNNLFVLNCQKLLNVFPFNMSNRLQNPVKFEVKNCYSLEEIFELQILNANELGAVTATPSIMEETAPSFVFPKLTVLHFNGLLKLKSFYSKKHTMDWPLLREMRLNGSDTLEIILSSKSLNFGKSAIQKPFLLVNEETHLWKEEYNLSGAFCKLRSLEVYDCGKLKNLVPSSVSFENLRRLKIFRCHGFVNLIACSTAKSLMQLISMTIVDCDMIKEIIASDGDEVKGGIVFTRLKYLNLNGLQSLVSFCLGKHSFEFPALEKVSVIGCPEMKIFSQGDLSTPILQSVQFNKSEDEGCWKGSLNSTIQWSFAEKVGYCETRRLLLSDSSKWREIWRSPQGILSFKSLEQLEVNDCSTLRCLFTLSIALDLPQLYWLKVKNCIVMEHIIVGEGSDEEVGNKIIFPQLRLITLESCADLASFYQGSKILKFPSLIQLEVIDCPKMFAFASTISREQRMETIDDGGNTSRLSTNAAFFNNMVKFPQLKGLMIKRLENCKKIWHDELIDDSFYKLNHLWVSNCDKLVNVFSFNMSHRLQSLLEFRVRNCDSLKEIIELGVHYIDELHAATATESIVFTSLKYLHLSCLPSLASFCSEKHNFEFPALEKMFVRKCPKMKIFCEGDLWAPQLQKVILAEDKYAERWLWQGNLKTTIQRLFEETNVQNPKDEDEENEDVDEKMWQQKVGRKIQRIVWYKNIGGRVR